MRCARIISCGLRKERAGLHGRVIRDDHAWNPGNIADPGDSAGGGNGAPLLDTFCRRPRDRTRRKVRLYRANAQYVRAQETRPMFALTILPGFAAAFAQIASSLIGSRDKAARKRPARGGRSFQTLVRTADSLRGYVVRFSRRTQTGPPRYR